MRFTLKNPRSLQYIDYQNVRKTEFLGCQSQEKCSVHRSGSSAHEGPHKGLVVSKKADLAHEVFTRSKVVRKKEANHARRSRVCRRRFNVLGQDWSSALRISAARAGETSLERSSRGAAAMRATEP